MKKFLLFALNALCIIGAAITFAYMIKYGIAGRVSEACACSTACALYIFSTYTLNQNLWQR